MAVFGSPLADFYVGAKTPSIVRRLFFGVNSLFLILHDSLECSSIAPTEDIVLLFPPICGKRASSSAGQAATYPVNSFIRASSVLYYTNYCVCLSSWEKPSANSRRPIRAFFSVVVVLTY